APPPSLTRSSRADFAGGDLQAVLGTAPGKQYALLIATDDYVDPGWRHLNNPYFDATALKEVLEKGYHYDEVDLLAPNPTLEQMRAALAKWARKKYEQGDQLLIFVAGHGDVDKEFNEGYFVPHDARKEDLGRGSYLSHSD